MDNTVFKNERYETFEYELLSLQNNKYAHKADITNYVQSCNLKLNFDNEIIGNISLLINDNADIDYLSEFIKIWYNITGSGLSYRIPLGVFTLTAPQKDSDGKTVHRNVKGQDLLKVLDDDKTTVASSFPSGTNVVDAIETILDGVGSWVQYSIEPSTETLSEDMTYELGRSKLYIINGLLNAINYYPLWCTGNGVFKAVKWTSTLTVTWEFINNDESLYNENLSSYIDYASMYNKVIVVTNELEADTAPITSILTFEDEGLEAHPYSYTNIGRYVTKIFRSEAVSQSYADARAKRELYKMLEINEAVNFKHAFITSRENDGLPYQGDCYRFKNTLLNIDSYFKIQSMSYNLGVGKLIDSTVRRFTNV